MPLPTIQPVDWPDWGAVPTFTTQEINVTTVAASGQVLVEIAAGYYSHALVVLQADGDGSSWTVELAWYTAKASEGGSLVGSVRTTRVFPGIVVIPMTAWAPILRITDVDADTYPHNFIATVTLFSDRGFMNGYPGGITVIGQTVTVPGSDTWEFNGLSCGPGRHTMMLETDATSWMLELITFIDPFNSVRSFLADDTTTPLYAIEFSPPASSWTLFFTNNDVGDVDVSMLVVRDP